MSFTAGAFVPLMAFGPLRFRFLGKAFRRYADLHVAGAQPKKAAAALVQDLDLHLVEFHAEHVQCFLDGVLACLCGCFN
jgi:pentose-5-phosphate-3-epimerase